MQYKPVIVRIHKARAIMTMLNTLNSGDRKKNKRVSLEDTLKH